MKTTVKILRSVLITLVLITSSCEKSETEIHLPEEAQMEEGFKGQTQSADSQIDETHDRLLPLLHKRYDADLTLDEAKDLFRKEVSEFRKKTDLSGKLASYVFFAIITKTGTRAYSQTDGEVVAAVSFASDQGLLHTPVFSLDNKGADRENGSLDFYYYGFHVPPISWLEAKIAAVGLQGTDGWFIESFVVWANANQYYDGVSGTTSIFTRPRIWLDNTTPDGWDYYNTGLIGQGRLTF